MSDARIKFLESLQGLQKDANEAIEFLNKMIEEPLLPTLLRLKFAKLQSIITIQRDLIRSMNEQQMTLADEVQDLVAKHLPKKD